MNVFDQPDNFPPILFHAWEYLKVNGPTKQEILESALAPKSFAQTAHANVKSTINLGIRVQIFDRTTDVLSNSARTNTCADFNSFRRMARDIFFDQSTNNYQETKNQKGNIQLAAAWFLSFPFEQTPGNWSQAEKELPKDFSREHTHWPIQNQTQWIGFERWMRFLGLGVQGVGRAESIIIQPCIDELVRELIDDLAVGSRTPIKEFIDELNLRLPSLPGGTVFANLPPGVTNRIKTRNTALIAQTLRNAMTLGKVKLEVGVDVANREVFAIDAGDLSFDFVVKESTR